jgi:hypothetical protein
VVKPFAATDEHGGGLTDGAVTVDALHLLRATAAETGPAGSV